MKEFAIDLLAPIEAIDYAQHLHRHFAESFDDELYFHPFEDIPDFTGKENLEKMRLSWKAKVGERSWERVWVFRSEGRIVGHLDLRSHKLPMVKHRCLLGLGIEKSWRAKGLGKALMKIGLDWARSQPGLDWIELNVFSHNLPAIKLYQRMGFDHLGETPDQFRVRGKSINDVKMALKLR